MGKRKPPAPKAPESKSPFNAAFSGLAGLKAQLEESAPPAPEEPPPEEAPKKEEGPKTRFSKAQKVVLQREKKGRGGKTITRISGLVMEPKAANKLAKDLKRALGCGASVEAETVILQGDQTERAAQWFREQGAKVVIGN